MELQEKHKLALSQIAYVGDDLIDLPVMLQVGLSFAVANAVLEVKDQANYVTKNYGGNGAVREIAEMLLKAQGKWGNIIDSYLLKGKSQQETEQ